MTRTFGWNDASYLEPIGVYSFHWILYMLSLRGPVAQQPVSGVMFRLTTLNRTLCDLLPRANHTGALKLMHNFIFSYFPAFSDHLVLWSSSGIQRCANKWIQYTADATTWTRPSCYSIMFCLLGRNYSLPRSCSNCNSRSFYRNYLLYSTSIWFCANPKTWCLAFATRRAAYKLSVWLGNLTVIRLQISLAFRSVRTSCPSQNTQYTSWETNDFRI